MTWNHRVVKRVIAGNDPFFQIHEVYYAEKRGEPHSITTEASAPYGESPEVLKREIQMMLAACDKPILNYEDIP